MRNESHGMRCKRRLHQDQKRHFLLFLLFLLLSFSSSSSPLRFSYFADDAAQFRKFLPMVMYHSRRRKNILRIVAENTPSIQASGCLCLLYAVSESLSVSVSFLSSVFLSVCLRVSLSLSLSLSPSLSPSPPFPLLYPPPFLS